MFGRSDCSIRDHFEAVVVLHYQLKIKLRNAKRLTGVATNLRVNKNKNECLELLTSRGIQLIEIDQIASAEVMTENSRFKSIPIKRAL